MSDAISKLSTEYRAELYRSMRYIDLTGTQRSKFLRMEEGQTLTTECFWSTAATKAGAWNARWSTEETGYRSVFITIQDAHEAPLPPALGNPSDLLEGGETILKPGTKLRLVSKKFRSKVSEVGYGNSKKYHQTTEFITLEIVYDDNRTATFQQARREFYQKRDRDIRLSLPNMVQRLQEAIGIFQDGQKRLDDASSFKKLEDKCDEIQTITQNLTEALVKDDRFNKFKNDMTEIWDVAIALSNWFYNLDKPVAGIWDHRPSVQDLLKDAERCYKQLRRKYTPESDASLAAPRDDLAPEN